MAQHSTGSMEQMPQFLNTITAAQPYEEFLVRGIFAIGEDTQGYDTRILPRPGHHLQPEGLAGTWIVSVAGKSLHPRLCDPAILHVLCLQRIIVELHRQFPTSIPYPMRMYPTYWRALT